MLVQATSDKMCGRRISYCVDSKLKIWPETPTGRCYFEALDLDRTIVQKLILKKNRAWGCDSAGSRQDPVAVSCEHSNELLGYREDG